MRTLPSLPILIVLNSAFPRLKAFQAKVIFHSMISIALPLGLGNFDQGDSCIDKFHIMEYNDSRNPEDDLWEEWLFVEAATVP